LYYLIRPITKWTKVSLPVRSRCMVKIRQWLTCYKSVFGLNSVLKKPSSHTQKARCRPLENTVIINVPRRGISFMTPSGSPWRLIISSFNIQNDCHPYSKFLPPIVTGKNKAHRIFWMSHKIMSHKKIYVWRLCSGTLKQKYINPLSLSKCKQLKIQFMLD